MKRAAKNWEVTNAMSCIETRTNGDAIKEIGDITARIEVRPPYFALQHLRREGGAICAEVVAEQPLYEELAPMSGAEIGRHLAIVGSCALSAINPKPGQHYYLARHAKYKAHPLPADLADGSEFRVVTHNAGLTGRIGHAANQLTTLAGAPIVSLDVEYQVMSARMFEKLFAAHKQPIETVDHDTYRREMAFPPHQVNGGCLTAVIGPIAPEACSGHFEAYPCIPVAVLMGWLTRAAGRLLAHQMNRSSIEFRVEQAEVSAEQLAFANEPVYLDVRPQIDAPENSSSRSFVCEARDAEGRRFGGMEVRLSSGRAL